MAENTGQIMPAWWDEIAEDLANLNIVWVTVTDTGTKTSPAWTPVVVLHVEHFHYVLDGPDSTPPMPGAACAAFPWAFAQRASEADAWKACEVFLRGLAAVRTATKDRAPWSEQTKTPPACRRRAKRACSAVDVWHERFHGLTPGPGGATT